MRRENKEFQMCIAIYTAIMHDSLLKNFKHNWGAIYYKVLQNGWENVPDLWIDLLYDWMTKNYAYYFP